MNSQTQFGEAINNSHVAGNLVVVSDSAVDAAIQRVINKQSILNDLKPKRRPIDLPSGRLYARGLTPSQAADLQEKAKESDKDFFVQLLIATVVYEDNSPVFSEEDANDLRDSGNAELEPLHNAALIAVGFRKDPDAKNSEATPSVASASGSH